MEHTKIRSILILSHFETVKEDTSPENLRKFLESDDPALVQMGLSMAKGSGVPEDLLPTILKLYMWNDDKTVRAVAKSVFNNCAPENLKEIIKNNWKPSYRTLSVRSPKKGSTYFKEKTGLAKIIPELINEFQSKDYTVIALYPYTQILKSEPPYAYDLLRSIQAAAEALGELGELTRSNNLSSLVAPVAVEPLIEALELHNNNFVEESIVISLGNIQDKRAVEPLIKSLDSNQRNWKMAALALGKIRDIRAIKPLREKLQQEFSFRKTPSWQMMKTKLTMIEPIIESLRKFGIPGIEAIAAAGHSDFLTLLEIKKLLREKNLPISGTKSELIERLKE
jgi:hypothetical protein